MSEKELRKSQAVFPIGTVIKLTGLTARQIRYYEKHGFFKTGRSAGNHRLYSLNDVDMILDVSDGLQAGYEMTELKARLLKNTASSKVVQWHEPEVTDTKVRQLFQDEFMAARGLGSTNPFER